MRIFLDNVNINSPSGPNGFAKKISREFNKDHEVFTSVNQLIHNHKKPDVQISFIATQYNLAPIVQRLDGIYFNSEQDFDDLNSTIENTFNIADSVIFQSEFNKQLTQSFFSVKEDCHVIHNGTCLDVIEKIDPIKNENLDKFNKIWSCASSWRPHKRLNENIRYFLEFAPEDAILAVAGKGAASERLHHRFNERIKFLGELDYVSLLSLYKRSTTFIHLAYLDHCPNVVVDAQAAGCKIICSATGGTSEIVNNGKIINEPIWNFAPIKLYEPPEMNFENMIEVTTEMSEDRKPSIEKCAKKYYDIIRSIA